LISPDPLRKEFLAHERLVATLYKACKPDPAIVEFDSQVACLVTIASDIRQRLGEAPADVSEVMADINKVLDASIAADGFRIRAAGKTAPYGLVDISRIDFEALGNSFAKSKTKNIDLEHLKAAIRAQLDRLVKLNKTRANYLVKFEELIESYNSGSRNIEELFKDLVELSKGLSSEQERHLRENLSEAELTVFDVLTRPGPELSAEEREQVKKVARQLLVRMQELLVLDWRKRNDARAKVRLAIEDALDEGLPRAYTPETYRQKCTAVFEHVYEGYADKETNIYAVSPI
jgi:type I restriction enzyme R subunit